MTHREFDDFWEDITAEVDLIYSTKGKEYAHNDIDRLANFKRGAEMTGMKPIQVWLIFFTKHLDAIIYFVKEGHLESDETIHGRFVDAIAYLGLGAALVYEEIAECRGPATLEAE